MSRMKSGFPPRLGKARGAAIHSGFSAELLRGGALKPRLGEVRARRSRAAPEA